MTTIADRLRGELAAKIQELPPLATEIVTRMLHRIAVVETELRGAIAKAEHEPRFSWLRRELARTIFDVGVAG